MKKTLYISDLDGTLLNSRAELSDFSARTLRELTANGLSFGVATARSPATAAGKMSGIPLSVPTILLNGVCLYDLNTGKYANIEYISREICSELIGIIHRHSLAGFLFTVEDGQQHTYYESTDSPNAISFIEERRRKYGKKFMKTDDFADCAAKGTVYYSISDTKEKLLAAHEEICALDGVHAEFYSDVYNEGYWYMEICSSTASKYRAAMLLRERYGFERLVGFGDNYNDLPLFDACDECYAPINANEEIKRRADGVIDSNDGDGVAKKLIELAAK